MLKRWHLTKKSPNKNEDEDWKPMIFACVCVSIHVFLLLLLGELSGRSGGELEHKNNWMKNRPYFIFALFGGVKAVLPQFKLYEPKKVVGYIFIIQYNLI